MVSDLTMRVLEEIRDAVRDSNGRMDRHIELTERRFEAVEQALEQGFDSVGRRIVEGEMRIATILTTLSGDLHQLATDAGSARQLSGRVDRCEQEIRKLKERVGVP